MQLPFDISEQLNALEGEIASQKVYSNGLLRKIQLASLYTDHQKHPKEIPASKPSHIPLGAKGDDKSKTHLESLQKLLQDETHVGEIHSDAVLGKDQEENNGLGQDEGLDEDGVINQNGEVIDNTDTSDDSVIAILVFVCNRPSVSRCLDTLIKLRPSSKKFPIIVSQDCGLHPETSAVLDSYGDQITRIVVRKDFVFCNLLCFHVLN